MIYFCGHDVECIALGDAADTSENVHYDRGDEAEGHAILDLDHFHCDVKVCTKAEEVHQWANENEAQLGDFRNLNQSSSRILVDHAGGLRDYVSFNHRLLSCIPKLPRPQSRCFSIDASISLN